MEEGRVQTKHKSRILLVLIVFLLLFVGLAAALMLLFLKKSEEVEILRAELDRNMKSFNIEAKKLRERNAELEKRIASVEAVESALAFYEQLETVTTASSAASEKLQLTRELRSKVVDNLQVGDMDAVADTLAVAKEAVDSSRIAAENAQAAYKAAKTAFKKAGVEFAEKKEEMKQLLSASKTEASLTQIKAYTAEAVHCLLETDISLAEVRASLDKVQSATDLSEAKKEAQAAHAASDKAKDSAAMAETAMTSAVDLGDAIQGVAASYLDLAKSAVTDAQNQAIAADEAANAAEAACTERENPTFTSQSVLESTALSVIPETAVNMTNLGAYFTVSEIARDGEVFSRINGKSYRDNPDIGLEQLRYLKVLHWNYNGEIQVGELICNVAVAQSLQSIFMELFSARYQIYSMVLVENFWTGDGLTTDEASVRANNTSAFNYRRASDAPNLSNHAFGKAVDLNPKDNPYIALGANGWYTDPHIDYPAGQEGYGNPDLRAGLPHAMTGNDVAVQIFKKYGFTWSGDWSGASRDFQHFERLG